VNWDDLVLVGIVARPHGNKGEVIVNPHTDFLEERFRVGARFETRIGDGERRFVELRSVRLQRGRPVIGLVGVESIADAERLGGAELRMDPAEQRALPAGVYYHHQLIGCDVVTESGAPLGRVVAVEGEMAASRLAVQGPRRQREIPLAEAICTVDLGARRITVRPPSGLLEL
jgi:16S rRNA processing protein RimM